METNDTTAKAIFEDTIKSFVGSVSNHLSDWLKTHKDVEISSEEICTAFNVPYQPPITPGLPSAMGLQGNIPINMPHYMKGSGMSPKRRGGRQKKQYDENHPKCNYIFQRGAKAGEKCTAHCLNDGSLGADKYCKNCLGKAAVKKGLEQNPPKSKVNAPSLEGNVISIESPKSKANEEIVAHEIEDRPGFYREVNHGFIVFQDSDGSLTTMQIDDNGEVRSLTDEEKTIALELGLNIADNSSPAPQIPISES